MTNNTNLRVVLFKSRNKDNKHIQEFKERTITFLTTKNPIELQDDFNRFVNDGMSGETCRFYISVNERDNKKLKASVLHFLIDNEYFDMSKIESKIVSLASRKENRNGNKWLFDFDEKSEKLPEFLNDLDQYVDNKNIETHKTPNGYAVIVDHGFDTRELLEKWKNVELKRDALLCYDWEINQNNKTAI